MFFSVRYIYFETFLLLFFSSFFLTQCVRVPAEIHEIATPFKRKINWIITEDIAFETKKPNLSGSVPIGFVTDLATIPKPFWFLMTPYGRYSKASIVHDYLYWFQPCSRKEADLAMLKIMRQDDVSPIKQLLIYTVVRLLGSPSWHENLRECESGLCKRVRFPLTFIPLRHTWNELRKKISHTPHTYDHSNH